MRMKGIYPKVAIATVLVIIGATAFADDDDNDDDGVSLSSHFFKKGNVIFFHPDGTGLNHWSAARLYFKGVDAKLNWDLLPYMAAYRGHMNHE